MRAAATKTVPPRTFRSGPYLERLMAELDHASISVRLGQAREQAGLTQPQMADLLEVHWRTVQNWESPKVDTVPWDRIQEWARLTSKPAEWLLHGEELVELDALDKRLVAFRDELAEIREELRRRHQEVLERLDTIAEQQRQLAIRLPSETIR